MRNTVQFDRPVRLMVPVWHQQPINSSSSKRLQYIRPMSILELRPNTSYKCSELQSLIDRGAVFASDADRTYVCSCGFVPEMNGVDPVSPLSTGMDPEEELN